MSNKSFNLYKRIKNIIRKIQLNIYINKLYSACYSGNLEQAIDLSEKVFTTISELEETDKEKFITQLTNLEQIIDHLYFTR